MKPTAAGSNPVVPSRNTKIPGVGSEVRWNLSGRERSRRTPQPCSKYRVSEEGVRKRWSVGQVHIVSVFIHQQCTGHILSRRSSSWEPSLQLSGSLAVDRVAPTAGGFSRQLWRERAAPYGSKSPPSLLVPTEGFMAPSSSRTHFWAHTVTAFSDMGGLAWGRRRPFG